MTEEDAKQRWCPAARIAVAVRPSDDLDYASNRPTHDPYNCIGSACMAWRWHPATGAPDPGPQHKTGYCGLAGPVQ